MDECNDSDFDFPILRKKNENEKVLRVTSLQPNATQKVKQPLARNISSPTRFNYSMKVKVDNKNRNSDTSFGSKMSFRGFIRRMSTKDRRRPTADSDYMRERRRGVILGGGGGGNKVLSIRLVLFYTCDDVTLLLAGFTKQSLCRSINEEEAVNNSLEERDENDERVTSYISKCSEETDDDTSVSESYSYSIHI